MRKFTSETISEDQMIALLGEPDFRATPAEWRYKLTVPFSVFFHNDYWLSVIVGIENKKVVKAAVHQG